MAEPPVPSPRFIAHSDGVVTSPTSLYFADRIVCGADDHIDFQLAQNTSTGALLNQTIFSTLTHTGSGTYVRNASNWLRGTSTNGLVDLTPLAVYNSDNPVMGVVLISPRHFISYSAIPNGTTIRFVTNTNTIVSRTISSTTTVAPGGLVSVGKLDSDVPNTISFAKILPANVPIRSQTGRVMAYVTITDQKAWVADQGNPNLTTALTIAGKSAYKQRALGYTTIGYPATSDAGAPYFYVFDRELVYAGPSNEDKDGFWGVSFRHALINAAMTSLGGGYQLTDYTPTILPPHPPVETAYIAGLTNLYRASSRVMGGVFNDSSSVLAIDIDNRALSGSWGATSLDVTTLTLAGDSVTVALGLANFERHDDNLSTLEDFSAARANLELTALATTTPGTGVATALGVSVGSTGSFIRFVSAPASAGATGVTGNWSYDASYIYVCTATNTWKRVAIATW